MLSKLFPLFVIVFVCAISAAAQRVIETESAIAVTGNEAVVSLAVESDRDLKSAISRIEFLNTSDSVKFTALKHDVNLRSGKQNVEFRFRASELSEPNGNDITWYRLRYSIGATNGIVSVSQLLHDNFELRIISSDNLLSGMTYRARIRALNPFSERPAAGVTIETRVELELKGDDDRKLSLKGSGVTDADGFAVIDFAIPPEAELDEDGEVIVTGTRNGLTRKAEEEIRSLSEDVQILVMTDKPIYQPGQTLNLRGILLKGVESKTILAGSEVEFRIEDEDDTLLYREKVMSSPFGIAAIGWQVPANAKLGQYRIQIRDDRGQQIGGHSVKVTRYDLPNFSVIAKPSKPYYLPADKEAEIEIRADYLFGKPVTKGKVRVVEETSREWNWKEQKYEVNEGEAREGETDTDGKFIAKFDLTDTHEDLKDEEDDKYDDLKFAAYFTDPTTNKTEQRRFDVRVSREPIHVYLIRGDNFGNSRLPVRAYVSTFYPDGTPAACDVEIKASEEDEEKFRTYARIKTNSYGGGKFTIPRPNIGDPDDDLDFRLVARDKNGRRGTFNDNVYFSDSDDAIRVTIGKTIYKPGETVEAAIETTVKTGVVYIDVVSGWSVLESRFAPLKDGRAQIAIPYSPTFQGELKIAAYVEDPDDDDDFVDTATGVIFPAKQGISVDASFDKAVYKPNEEATVKFGILDVAGRAIESALGVVVFDKAVEERARTDAEFGGVFRNLGGWLGYGDGFGSVNVKDLNELDLAKPISDDLQLVAEIILHDSYYTPNSFRSSDYVSEAKSVFEPLIGEKLRPVETALKDAYNRKNFLHPVNDASLASILEPYGFDQAFLTDPWGQSYRTVYSVDRGRDLITIISSGPDKTPETKDDITAFSAGFEYFTPMGRMIDAAVNGYNARSGGFIRTGKNLMAEMGVSEMLDRFGRPYVLNFDGEGRHLRLHVVSPGRDGRIDPPRSYGDDFIVWTSSIDLFAAMERTVTRIQADLKTAPMNDAEFKASLKARGVDFDQLRDGNNRPLYVMAEKRSRYWDRVTVETIQVYGNPHRSERRIVTPVTQQIVQFTIRGVGADGKAATYDDITFTQYVHVLSEQSKDDPKPVPVMQPIAFGRNTGSIGGTVTDASGAAIPSATITAANDSTGVVRSTTSNEDGRFLIANLPAGTYRVSVQATAFQSTVIERVPVAAGATASLTIVMEVGNVSATVEVTAAADTVNSTNASVGTNITGQQITALPLNGRNAMQLIALKPGVVKAVTKSGTDEEESTTQQTSTPRLREYFPETLLWQPEVITGPDGKAELKFRMADNITTWKMYTIASTKNGRIGVAEKEVAAFQPFFVDLDPPKFLTTGDEIFLPTQVRNYTDKKQNVNVTMAKADWFGFLNGDAKQITVASGGSENAVFGFKALTPTKDGRQRVTAMAETDSDAIERPVTVRPDGREVVETDSKYFTGNTRFDLNFPANALANTQSAELKIYPNLMAHVAESVEGLLRRPYGCGEQTISSTYPNVMILKFAAPGENKPRRISESVEKKARKFLLRGYERLLGYQVTDGGFSYWGGKDSADFALTAYALRFLADASPFIAIDPEVVKKAEDWLIKQQRADGSWGKKYHWEEKEDDRRAKSTTTYVARTLAMRTKSSPPYKGGVAPASGNGVVPSSTLTKALAYLKSRNAEIDDPYSLSLLGLAAFDAGDEQLARGVAQKLVTLAKEENGGAYWNLESNTAFNGWGSAGRIETTALATQLFLRLKSDRELVGRAMIFLLKNKDRYGVWYSTQTTVNVLDAFVAAMAADDVAGTQQIQVVLNGQPVQTIDIGPDKIDQIVVKLDGKLASEKNIIELRSADRSPVMAQIVANHYIGWQDADASGRTVNQSRALRLDYKCDRADAAIMQEISCSVEAERIAFRGYGMLLAEIGTPPGADVSRESLQAAMESDWSISRYDILPDRVVVYMWATPGGSKFNFKFKPRYRINAQTPASVVYDYYNPEAQATAAPLRFLVR